MHVSTIESDRQRQVRARQLLPIPLAAIDEEHLLFAKRMVKKQQMRWSQRGAHLLLQVRTRFLNDELREVFRQWYPNFDQGDEDQKLAA